MLKGYIASDLMFAQSIKKRKGETVFTVNFCKLDVIVISFHSHQMFFFHSLNVGGNPLMVPSI